MSIRYIGRAFRERHGIKLRELARGTDLRPGTIIDMELGRTLPNTETVGLIVAFFRAHDIPCEVSDLLTYDEEQNGRRDPSE